MNIKKDLISKITEVLAELSPRQGRGHKSLFIEEQLEFPFEQPVVRIEANLESYSPSFQRGG